MSEAETLGAGAPPPPPQFLGEKIIFYCPRGHRLVVAAKHAGKHGRCDRKGCGAPVTIPVPRIEAESVTAAPEVDLEPVEPPAAALPQADVPESRTRQASAAMADPTGVDTTGTVHEPFSATAQTTEPDGGGWDFINDSQAGAAADEDGDVSATAAPGRPLADGVDNPMARLVARLWRERDHGGIVELHLVGGSVVLPEWYEARWSGGTHGLFASQAPDGTMTLTAVAWDAIQKVVVRQVRDLPDGMFE